MKNIKRVSIWLCIVFLLSGITTWATYQLIGSEIDANGYLIEPFFLIPITYLLIFSGGIFGIIHIFSRFLVKSE